MLTLPTIRQFRKSRDLPVRTDLRLISSVYIRRPGAAVWYGTVDGPLISAGDVSKTGIATKQFYFVESHLFQSIFIGGVYRNFAGIPRWVGGYFVPWFLISN